MSINCLEDSQAEFSNAAFVTARICGNCHLRDVVHQWKAFGSHMATNLVTWKTI